MDIILYNIHKHILIIIHADQVTGENIGSNATSYWARLVQPCIETNTRWITVFGNHGEDET